jgi:SAM-dependent methyltransferase
MGDLLELDFSGLSQFTLHGFDLDQESLDLAAKRAGERGLEERCFFFKRDAWALGEGAEFDLIASNGLNFYEADDAKTVDLYREFYRRLKPGGVLVTSFMTPPSSWNAGQVDKFDAMQQKALFTDVLEAKWQIFRVEDSIREHLQQAGFAQVEVIYDRARIFPTVIATKE